MRRSYHKKRPKTADIQFKINEQIKSPTIILIDDEGNHLGELKTKDAIAKAEEIGLDLVEVNPKSDPPIAKIIDYGNLKYRKVKQQQKQKVKLKKVENKGIRLSPRISQHDRDVRYEQAKKFLTKGHRVTLELILRGREHRYVELAKELLAQFVKDLEAEETFDIRVEQSPQK